MRAEPRLATAPIRSERKVMWAPPRASSLLRAHRTFGVGAVPERGLNDRKQKGKEAVLETRGLTSPGQTGSLRGDGLWPQPNVTPQRPSQTPGLLLLGDSQQAQGSPLSTRAAPASTAGEPRGSRCACQVPFSFGLQMEAQAFPNAAHICECGKRARERGGRKLDFVWLVFKCLLRMC